jgi:hypothetical protein
MASPSYDSSRIFDSISSDNGLLFSEGILEALDYQGLFQALQFNGENGTRWLSHGWPSRQWVFRGILSAPTLSELNGIFNGIQLAIDKAVADPKDYWKVLTDSFGNTFHRAQVRTFHKLQPTQICVGGFLCTVQVTGLIESMDQENRGGG